MAVSVHFIFQIFPLCARDTFSSRLKHCSGQQPLSAQPLLSPHLITHFQPTHHLHHSCYFQTASFSPAFPSGYCPVSFLNFQNPSKSCRCRKQKGSPKAYLPNLLNFLICPFKRIMSLLFSMTIPICISSECVNIGLAKKVHLGFSIRSYRKI